jgi:hypothetical protein
MYFLNPALQFDFKNITILYKWDVEEVESWRKINIVYTINIKIKKHK